MLNSYKIRLIKIYDFDLDGTSEKNIREQVAYISEQTKILDLPEVRKTVKIKIKKNHDRKENNEKHS